MFNLHKRSQISFTKKTKDNLNGGYGDDMPDTAFPPEAMNKGLKVEHEHTNDNELAEEIVKDHLTENIHYYDYLEDMEKKFKEDDKKEDFSSVNDIEKKYNFTDIKIFERKDFIYIHKIVIPQELRDKGIGTQIMNDICDYADSKNKTITLLLNDEDYEEEKGWGTKSKDSLIRFYKRFGFVENKGSNQNNLMVDDMYRKPNTGQSQEEKVASRKIFNLNIYKQSSTSLSL